MLFIYMVGDNCRIPGRSAPLNPMYFSLSQHRWRRPSDEMRQLLMFISSACSLKTLFCKWARKASLICGRGNSIMITTQEYKQFLLGSLTSVYEIFSFLSVSSRTASPQPSLMFLQCDTSSTSNCLQFSQISNIKASVTPTK